MDITTSDTTRRTSSLILSWGSLDPAWRWAITLTSSYLALFSFWTAWVSSVFPRFHEEAGITIWPIQAPLDYWFQRTLLWSISRYDVFWYVGIAEYGYGHRLGDTAFHPLYPLLMGLVGRLLGGNYLLGGWLVTQVCCVTMLSLLYRLVRLDYDDAVARRTTLFLIGSPLGFAFFLPYTESLLMLCIVAALYAGRQERWWLAGLAGAGAALTKQPGAVVILPLLWEFWARYGAGLRAGNWRPALVPLLGLALTPLGLLIWLAYRATLGDIAFTWNDPSTFVSALLVTPKYKEVWSEYFSWPWVNFQYALAQLQSRLYFYLILNLFVMLIMVTLTLFSMLRLRASYVIYSLVLMLMNLSIVYPLWPYMGIIRRFTIIFPMFIQLAVWGRSRGMTAFVLVVNALLWVFIAEMYVRNAFVP